MQQFLKAKIHGATVTAAELDYEGSFGIDSNMMEQVGIHSFEAIEIYNITQGTRLKTYAIPLERGCRQFQSNGAAAHLVKAGDKVIIAAYQFYTDEQLKDFLGPKILLMGAENEAKKLYQPDRRAADGSAPLTDFDLLSKSI